jgi:hypothetical protein
MTEGRGDKITDRLLAEVSGERHDNFFKSPYGKRLP